MDQSVPSYPTISDQVDQLETPANEMDQAQILDNQRDLTETPANPLSPIAPPPTMDSTIVPNPQIVEACDPVKSRAKPIFPALYPSHSKTVLYVWIAMFLVWDVFWICLAVIDPVKNGKAFKGGIRFVWSCFDLLFCINSVLCYSHKTHGFYHIILFMNATSLMYYTTAMICIALFVSSSFGTYGQDVFYGLWPELIEYNLVKYKYPYQKQEYIIQGSVVLFIYYCFAIIILFEWQKVVWPMYKNVVVTAQKLDLKNVFVSGQRCI